jgi:hypothetical protein
MEQDESLQYDEEDIEGAGELTRRLVLYSVLAVVIIMVTVLAVLYMGDILTIDIGFSSTESILDTVLLALAFLLLVLFVTRIAASLLRRESSEAAPATRDRSAYPAAIALDGQDLTIMERTIQIPETLNSTVYHVLAEHADEISRRAQEMQANSGGEDLGGVNWALALLECIEEHIDESRISFSKSMTKVMGSLAREWRSKRR